MEENKDIKPTKVDYKAVFKEIRKRYERYYYC